MFELHAAVQSVINTQTYTPAVAGDSVASISKGMVVDLNPSYEISYKLIPIGNNTINIYCRTGADSFQQNVGSGEIVLRTFDTKAKQFNGDRTIVYTNAMWAVIESKAHIINGSIWLFVTEFDRLTQLIIRNSVLISTDGLVGKTFGAPIVQSFMDYVVANSVATDGAGNTWVYYGYGLGAPGGLGLRRAKCNPNGVLSEYSQVWAGNMSEGEVINVIENTNNLICLYRLDTGTNVLMLKSTDGGASWTPSGTGLNTGLGAASGAKVQIKAIKSVRDPNKFLVTFMDRGAANWDCISTLNLNTDGFNNVWHKQAALSPSFTGSNGNSSPCILDVDKGEYLYVACSQGSGNSPNSMCWWIFNDGNKTPPRPWI